MAIGIVTKNLVTYSSYMLQITNRINKYVILTIAQRLTYGVAVAVLLILRVNDFYWYCLADLCGDVVGIVIGVSFNRGLYLGKMIKPSEAFKEIKVNVASGIILMLANWSAMLMIYTVALGRACFRQGIFCVQRVKRVLGVCDGD